MYLTTSSGDKGYYCNLNGTVIAPYKGARELTQQEQAFNTSMSKSRVSVEWGFLGVSKRFSYMDLHKGIVLYMCPIQ